MKKILLVVLLLVSIQCMSQPKPIRQKGEVIYHLFLRSFYDSNGDLHGDFNGLKSKLPYLQELGITSILLLPLYDADCYHNYFANDFEQTDAEFGTMEEYISLVKEIHRRGMKVYMDMETQYVAEKHKWWKSALGNLQSPYRDYILFEDAKHEVPATMVFDLRQLNSYDGSVIKVTSVNLKNPEVLEYNKKLFGYFVDPNADGRFEDGVDGFRLDHAMDTLDGKLALSGLFEVFWKPLLMHVKKINPKLNNVAEQSDWKDYGFTYFEKAGVDRMFGFGLQQAILSFNKKELIRNADTILAKCPPGKDQIIFIENHDLDRFASFESDAKRQRVAASILLLIGGTPSIYYGQEIGMKGTIGKFGSTDGNDIPRRAAFEWYKSESGKGMAIWYKNTGGWWDNRPTKSNDGISLEEQKNDSSSLYNHYRKLIQLKQSYPGLSTGKYSNVVNDNEQVFSFYRTEKQNKMLVVVNLSADKQEAKLEDRWNLTKAVYGKGSIKNGSISLSPYQVLVFQVK